MIIEIVVYNFESAKMAQQGGANRIELCDNPAEGGTTPSLGMIQRVRASINIDLVVMIRPRGGDFLYSSDEFEIMKTDVMTAKRAGADGVVFGILKSDGQLDTDRCTELIQLARPMKAICHRAFDMTKDLLQTLEDCIGCGFDRILTSGGKLKAIDGVDVITQLNDLAKDRITIMPGSGINEENVAELMSKTGVNEIHLSAATIRESEMMWKNADISGMGSVQNSEFLIRTVNPNKISNIKKLVKSAS